MSGQVHVQMRSNVQPLKKECLCTPSSNCRHGIGRAPGMQNLILWIAWYVEKSPVHEIAWYVDSHL